MWRAQACKRGNEDDIASFVDLRSLRFNFARRRDDPQAVSKPLHRGARDERTALEGEASTRESWKHFIETMFKTCGKRGVTLMIDQKARQDTIATTVKFFSKTLASQK